MKVSKRQLRRIIKEELGNITEKFIADKGYKG
jgi:hypothetical protein